MKEVTDAGNASGEAVRRTFRQTVERGGREVQAGSGERGRSADVPARGSTDAAVGAPIEDWKHGGKVRGACGPATPPLTGTDEGQWLGWLGITEDQLAHRERFDQIVADIKVGGIKHALLLGMGGSSLCPKWCVCLSARSRASRNCIVLDSTDPAQIRALEKQDRLGQHFVSSCPANRARRSSPTSTSSISTSVKSRGAEASAFIAVTDPGSKMQQVAEARRVPKNLLRRP